jgi:ketosteroid isomerase-like protein
MKPQETENKRLALRWYEALLTGDLETCGDMLDDDCKFFMAGDMAWFGWRDKEFFMTMNILPLAGPITMEFGHIIAQGDLVFLEAESHADLAGGNRYNNNYGFLLRFKDGKLVEHKEYTDTLHLYRVVDSEAVRGEPIPRQSPLTIVTAVVSGVPGRDDSPMQPTAIANP